MIHITLICAAGMSTNLLVRKMKDYAISIDLECEIIAMSIDNFKEYQGETDVLLLGPHISYRLHEVNEMYKDNYKIAVIDMADYGMLDGAKVVKQAISYYKK